MSGMKQLAEQVREISDSIEEILGSNNETDVIIDTVMIQVSNLRRLVNLSSLEDIKEEPSIDGSNTKIKDSNNARARTFFRPNPQGYVSPLTKVIVEAETDNAPHELTGLEATISAACKSTNSKYSLSKTNIQKLSTPQRDAQGEIHPSANQLWVDAPMFRNYVVSRLKYLTESFPANLNPAFAVNCIVGYNQPYVGWMAYKAKYDHGGGILDWTD